MMIYEALTAKNDEKYMRRCIQLALNGISGASPNPMVGAVIVHEGRIIGEGYHRRCGGPHAEVNAIRSVRQPELLPESTIYCSLEPCSHYGKTPPCADLIIEKGIRRVVIGCKDPFAKVDGQGIRKLQEAGCEVVVGVLEKECLELNRRFITFHTERRPFVTLKWAQSRDGFIAAKGAEGVGCQPVTFSTPLTQTLVHKLRAHVDAILVGGRTAVVDDPSLSVRCWEGRDPLKVVIDTHGDLPAGLRIFSGEAEVLTWKDWDVRGLLKALYERGVQWLLVEGGAVVHRHFLEAGLWDEVRVETAPCVLHDGVKAPELPACTRVSSEVYGENEVRVYSGGVSR